GSLIPRFMLPLTGSQRPVVLWLYARYKARLTAGTAELRTPRRTASARPLDVTTRRATNAMTRKTSSRRVRTRAARTQDTTRSSLGDALSTTSYRKISRAKTPNQNTDRLVSIPLTNDHGALSVLSVIENESRDIARS